MSAFKTLYTQMIEAGGSYDALPASLRKKDLQVFVKETRPWFLVSDSFFYVPAYFTQAAITEYNQKFPQVNIQDLEAKVIIITNWSLELRKVNSTEVFTSYGGLECRLIVNSFKPQLKVENLHPTRYPTNLYRDDEFKTTVQAFRHKQVVAAAAAKPASMPAIGTGKGAVSQGILANSCGDWSFKEGNTKTVQLGGGKAKKAGGDTKVAVKGGSKKSAKKSAVKAKGAGPVAALVASGKASKGKKSISKAKPSPGTGKRTKPRSTSAMTVK
jgi:hypothetical protein